jgi:integrase
MEILTLKWDAVDLDRGHLRLGDTKTGASIRPLGASAAAVLKELKDKRLKDNPYVLPGSKKGSHIVDVQRLWYAVRHVAELGDVRLHDLRHSFASVSATDGESMLVLKSLLGHARISTTERYAHLGDDPVKRAADKASGDIAEWLSGRLQVAI